MPCPMLNQCWFADRVVRVRQKYNLSIDRREADALERVLNSCVSTALVRGGDRVEAAGVEPSRRYFFNRLMAHDFHASCPYSLS